MRTLPVRRGRWAAVLAVTGALLALPACASSVDPIERLGRKAAERVNPRPTPAKDAKDAVGAVDAVDAKGCKGPGKGRPVTPRSDELALRLTEC
ncbi:hypothetical protein AB0M38_23035 [Streptomyces sp. NPDC051742]|uniref:hypothetical protein n=1 Tax=unclassified Streptomyces TaxID=2593676 RepID=UPI00343447B1